MSELKKSEFTELLAIFFLGVQSHDSLVRYRVEHSKMNFLSASAHVVVYY